MNPAHQLVALFLAVVLAWGLLFAILVIIWSGTVKVAAARFEEILRAQQARGKEQLEVLVVIRDILATGAADWDVERRVMAAEKQLRLRGVQ